MAAARHISSDYAGVYAESVASVGVLTERERDRVPMTR
jgi:hypothetical protein